MKLLFLTDAYPPSNISGAVQSFYLVDELKKKFEVLVVTPSIKKNNFDKNIFHFYVPFLKSNNNYLRTLSEILMPLFLLVQFKFSKYYDKKWDGLIFYSPSIFFGPFVWFAKKKYQLKTYLVLRDIFPKWAWDLGIIKSQFVYFFFKLFERLQYASSDKIGVQTYDNFSYFQDYNYNFDIELLENWTSQNLYDTCKPPIKFNKTKTNLIYTGNIGAAQNFEFLLEVFKKISLSNVHIHIIGRGSEFSYMLQKSNDFKLKNIFFHNEISFKKIGSLIKQADIGLVSLSFKHKTHNIPNKFITYLSFGIPIFAVINSNNDIEDILRTYEIGDSISVNSVSLAVKKITNLILHVRRDKKGYLNRCNLVFNEKYTTKIAFKKIYNFFSKN